jgi:hypothetical protein
MGFFVVVHRNRLDFARALARADVVRDGAIGTDFGTEPALHAFTLVDTSFLVDAEVDRSSTAHFLTAMRDAAAANVRYFITSDGALVAGEVHDLNDIGVVLVSAHSQLDSLRQNRPLFIDATPHCRMRPRRDAFWNIGNVLKQIASKGMPRNLAQNLILQMLYLCVEFFHDISLPKRRDTTSSDGTVRLLFEPH